MYNKYYNFKDDPFRQVIDTEFSFDSQTIVTCKEKLQKMLDNEQGFILLTGESGVGKTFACKIFAKENKNIHFARIQCHPDICGIDLLRSVNESFGIKNGHKHTGFHQVRKQITEHIIGTAKQEKALVLFIDDAHHMSNEDLETIRLLSNIECESKKLIHIILCGQPVLKKKICAPNLRQLRQRLSQSLVMKNLNEEEVATYIKQKIEIAGGANHVRFSKKSIDVVFKYSNGNPLSINFLCQRAMTLAFKEKARLIDEKIIHRIIKEISKEQVTSKRRWFGRKMISFI